MSTNLGNLLTGGASLLNGYANRNDIRERLTEGRYGISDRYSNEPDAREKLTERQMASKSREDFSLPYKTAKQVYDKKIIENTMYFLFGDQVVSLYHPYKLYLPNDQFFQLQRLNNHAWQDGGQKTNAMHSTSWKDGYLKQYDLLGNKAEFDQPSVVENGMNDFGRGRYGEDTVSFGADGGSCSDMVKRGVERMGASDAGR